MAWKILVWFQILWEIKEDFRSGIQNENDGVKHFIFSKFTICSARPNSPFQCSVETETEYQKIAETEPKPNP